MTERVRSSTRIHATSHQPALQKWTLETVAALRSAMLEATHRGPLCLQEILSPDTLLSVLQTSLGFMKAEPVVIDVSRKLCHMCILYAVRMARGLPNWQC